MTVPLRTRELPVFPVSPEPAEPVVGHAARDPVPSAVGSEPVRIGLVTLGCDKNTVDSERMMAALAGAGATVRTGIEDADVVVVNTCGFIEMAREESVEAILEACSLKADGRVRSVVAVGCMVQRYKEELVREIPEVDLFMGLTEMPGLIEDLRGRGLLSSAPNSLMEVPLRILSTDTPHVSHLKISEGCDHTCAFCAIPHMRGLHRSAPLDELVMEACELERRGVRELNIVSQDTTWYGRDLRRAAVRAGRPDVPTPDLADLLEGVLDGTAIPWIRLFYMYPSGITERMVELLARESRLLSYLDVPIQHGSDGVLHRMRRPERQATIRDRVRRLREAVPDIVLRTTVIVGFPGETEDEFREMLDLLQEVEFDRVGAFPYSIEEGTLAATMDGHVSEAEKRDRLDALMDAQRDISFARNEEAIGSRELVIVDRVVDEDGQRWAEARTRGQAIEVDGLTRVEDGGDLTPGSFASVEIVDALDYDLVARAVARDDR